MRVVSAHRFARAAQSKEARKQPHGPPGHRISALVVISVAALDGAGNCEFVADIKEHKSTLRGLCVKLRIDQVVERVVS
jgi:hypothetical protein